MSDGSSARAEVMVVVGTRPEGVKTAPLVARIRQDRRFTARVVDTGQQPGRVAEALTPFGLTPSDVLRPDRVTGSLSELAALLITDLDGLLDRYRPAAVVVQGDTLTALVGGLVAFWHRTPVVHLEAGLRTHDLDRPFPEEANRAMLARFAALHLAPTPAAAHQLRREGVPDERILVTGNTVVDALHHLVDHGLARPPAWLDPGQRPILATAHRRENWGDGLRGIADGLARLAGHHPDHPVVVITHPNPAVGAELAGRLRHLPSVRLTPPLPYTEMVGLLSRAALVVTDSGGLQEEAATLGVPLVVTRDSTERPEAIADGRGALVGTDSDRLVAAALHHLSRAAVPPGPCPYGDGRAARRAVAAIADLVRPDVSTTRAAPLPTGSTATRSPSCTALS